MCNYTWNSNNYSGGSELFILNYWMNSLISISFLNRKSFRLGDTKGGIYIRNGEWCLPIYQFLFLFFWLVIFLSVSFNKPSYQVELSTLAQRRVSSLNSLYFFLFYPKCKEYVCTQLHCISCRKKRSTILQPYSLSLQFNEAELPHFLCRISQGTGEVVC